MSNPGSRRAALLSGALALGACGAPAVEPAPPAPPAASASPTALVEDDAPPAPPAEHVPDSVVRQNIVTQLQRSPYVDERHVAVFVEGGIATLSGRVADWRAKRISLSAARRAGARSIVDELTITDTPVPRNP